MSKSAIDAAAVEKIAALARLGLTPAEVAGATQDLSGILDHFSSIQAIDTAGVDPTNTVSQDTNITRPDTPAPSALCDAATLVDAAPASQKGHIQVKAVF